VIFLQRLETEKSEHVRVQERRDWHAYRRGRFTNGKGQYGQQENPDIPAKKEEVEAIAEAQWTGIRRG
jgi:hypothetical protein